ncbi:MAG: hypothetical protein ACE5J0_00815 [Candidatus Paceibacterales bacterium]
MKIPKLKPKKIKDFLKKLPRALGERAFLAFLGLFVLSLILGGLAFYKYSVLAKKTELQTTEKPLQFKEKTYQKVLETWQEKEKRFKETDVKEYPDPFTP